MDVTAINAMQGYSNLRQATAPDPTRQDGAQLRSLAQDFAATLQEGETAAVGAMTGDADPHSLVQALVQTELAVETAVTVRDRVVKAYQEILRMPV